MTALSPFHPASDVVGASSQSEEPGNVRVLIVDDDPKIRRIVSICLSLEAGFEVVGEASDGAKAVQLAATSHPDVVLLDLEMPGMNGLAAMPAIRAQVPDAKIAVLSAFPDPFTLGDALSRGADTYLDKAMGLAELPAVLRSLLESDERNDDPTSLMP